MTTGQQHQEVVVESTNGQQQHANEDGVGQQQQEELTSTLGILQETTIVENAASKGALCLDGTPPAYHLSEGFGPGKGNWMNNTTIQRFECILHNSSKFNPDFRSWTKVMVRYCDGSSLTGDVDPTIGLHFRGKRVFDAIVDDLLFSKGMKDAKEVLFTSGFAGELAVIIYYDRFANHFPNTTNVKCLSDGGFFLLSNNPLQA
ncbi:pectin acetylesterase 8-like [Ipomoea triloba]|uniref:pectin acetylesterase 8-like n=1 Tax=Ipomoea triloba TaxID=35885 RepID=UPI00125DDE3A|nr:pectin acetylesterase 8-like [Ipomoea triloba]